jgi:hypothetical protein
VSERVSVANFYTVCVSVAIFYKRGLDTRKIRVRTYNPISLSVPRPHKPVQNDRAMLEASLCLGRARLVLDRGHHLKLHHDAAISAGRILNLAPVFGFAVNGDVLWQSMLNPMATLTVPARQTVVNTKKPRTKRSAQINVSG